MQRNESLKCSQSGIFGSHSNLSIHRIIFFISLHHFIFSVTVARGAPPRAPIMPVEMEGNTGPRFDDNGNLLSHSILGSLEEYKTVAKAKGELQVGE